MTVQQIFKGRVKWFNLNRGFGFIVVNDTGEDILLHLNVLRSFGQSTIVEGAEVALYAQKSARGMQATEIVSIDLPTIESSDEVVPTSDEELNDLKPAKVKWFDRNRGFGFLNVFGYPDDIFIHSEVLRQSGMTDLQQGEAICARIGSGTKGKVATEIYPWDMACSIQKDLE